MHDISNGYDLSSLQVLIVEDNKFMQTLLRNILRMFKIQHIRIAGDGAEGLMELKNFNPDVIFCDWQMDVLDGIEFIRLVRTGSDTINPYVPIIMLTGFTETYRVYEARDAGATEFLAKPVSAQKLFDRIAMVIDRPRAFIKTASYFGPDRRRARSTEKTNKCRRKGDPQVESATSEPRDNPDANSATIASMAQDVVSHEHAQ